VIHAVSKSWRLSVFRPYLVWKRDRLLVLAAVLAVLMLGILNGLLVAIGFSLVLLLRQLATPRLSVLGRLADSHDFVDIAQHADAVQPTGALILRPEEPLFFANAESVITLARKRVEQRPGLSRVIVSLEASPDLDSTSLEAIADFATWLQSRGVSLRVARLKDDTRALLLRAALPQLSPHALNYWSVEDAVSAPSHPSNVTGTIAP
jgi:MFS superfamily sulfate permease-like transporter